MNDLNSFDKTDREYSPAHTDNLIRFWRSKVKVTAGRRGGGGIHVGAGGAKFIL